MTRLRTTAGDVLYLNVERWMDEAGPADLALLAEAIAPVLDVGCGPGRHVVALARQGMMAMGVDAAPSAAAIARSKGAAVLCRSVFSRLPGAGRWGSALLLDGNIGIGGDPTRLLGRVATLLRPDGAAFVEVAPPGTPTARLVVRVDNDDEVGPWFDWAVVGADGLDRLARPAGLRTTRLWESEGRWFARVDKLRDHDRPPTRSDSRRPAEVARPGDTRLW